MYEELNLKLAEWAGFSIRSAWDTGFQLFKTPQKPSPDGVHYDEEEFEENWYKPISTDYFTSSLDACFKWLVPKLTDAQRARLPGIFSHDGTFTFNWFWDNPSLALCLAIEKLVDAEEV